MTRWSDSSAGARRFPARWQMIIVCQSVQHNIGHRIKKGVANRIRLWIDSDMPGNVHCLPEPEQTTNTNNL